MVSLVKTVVYRVQPVGAALHKRRSTTSMDTFVPGVFVFASFESIDVAEWDSGRKPVELAKIAADEKDIYDPGDAQGYVLRKGKGKIIERVAFKNLHHLEEWVKECWRQGLTW